MKVLLLGPWRESMIDAIRATGDEVAQTEERLTPDHPLLDDAEFIVSYGYRFLLRPALLARFPKRVINLHISYLPYNRGADPNLWSILDRTPSGVTIHQVDAGLDTGPILEQRAVPYHDSDTLRTSYLRLSQSVEKLFAESWPLIRTGKCEALPQRGKGTSHKLADRAVAEHLLRLGWDTPILELQAGWPLTIQEELV